MIWFVFVSRGYHNKYFKLGSLTYRNLSSHSSGDEKSEVRCKQDHAPSEGGRKVLLVSLLHSGNSLAWSREILTVILTGCSLEEVIQRAWPPVHLRAARGKRRFFILSGVLGMYAWPTIPVPQTVLNDAVLREQRVIESVWVVYVTEPS